MKGKVIGIHVERVIGIFVVTVIGIHVGTVICTYIGSYAGTYIGCDRKIITLPVNQSQSKGISVDVKVRIRRRGNLRRKLTSADWETNLSIKSGAVLPTGKESAALDDAIQHSSFDSFVVVT